MSRFLSGLAGLILLVGCSVNVGGGGGGGSGLATRASISEYEYSRLMTMDYQSLFRRAQVGELGNCEVRNLGFQVGGCDAGDSYALYLNYRGIFYPVMNAYASQSARCASAVQAYVKDALREGFCYSRDSISYPEDSQVLKRRAQAGELGNCEVRNVGYQAMGCATGDSFVVYLRNKGVFFPGMSPDISGSAVCESFVGSNVREAVQAGLCP